MELENSGNVYKYLWIGWYICVPKSVKTVDVKLNVPYIHCFLPTNIFVFNFVLIEMYL